MLDSFICPIMRFLERQHRRVTLKRLASSGEIYRILRESPYKVTGPAQGEAAAVYRKEGGHDLNSVLFASSRRDEAGWWIVQRYWEDLELESDQTFFPLLSSVAKGYFINPMQRFLARRRMTSVMRDLRAKGELDQILQDSPYELIRGTAVIHRTKRKGYYFTSAEGDEVIWWIVQRHFEDKAGVDPTNDLVLCH